MARAQNAHVADQLDEVGQLLSEQGANRFRVEAYRRAAETLRGLDRPVGDLLKVDGLEGLEELVGIGPGLARAIAELATTGRLAILERLRGEHDPVGVLMSVPGVGHATAQRLHDQLGIHTLEQLEAAVHDGRLAALPGVGPKRIAGIRDALSGRLQRRRRPVPALMPPVQELLDVDQEYRDRAAAGRLRRIAPQRFNPSGAAWLPILHTARGDRHYTAVYSNTARAHRLGKTRDWVVVYVDSEGPEQQYTVVTASVGSLRGRRVVRGREPECLSLYQSRPGGTEPPESARTSKKSSDGSPVPSAV